MSTSRLPINILVFLLYILLDITGAVAADDSLEAEFMKYYSNLPSRPQLLVRATCQLKINTAKEKESRLYSLTVDGDFVSETKTKDARTVIKVKNDKYVFAVSQANNKNSIAYLEPLVGSELEKANLYIERDCVPILYLLSGTCVGGVSLREIVASPRFHLHSATPLESNSDLVKVEFSYDFEDTGDYPYGYERSIIICDKSNNWFVIESDAHCIRGKTRAKVQYLTTTTPGPIANGITLATAYRQRILQDGNETEYICSNEISDSPIDKQEFYLPFYGFPEPTFSRNISIYWWLLGGALAIGAAVGVRRFRLRNS